jgi:hypothetical protein
MDITQTEWKRTGDKYSQLTPHESHIFSVLHIEVVTRPYVMSKISYFIVRTFDVKHHAAHGTILINFGSEKRS